MKLHKSIVGILAALLAYSFNSCVDDSFDLSKISKEIELFGNSISGPVCKATLRMDSIVSRLGIDANTLSVEDGKYVFNYSGSMDMSGLLSSIKNYSFPDISPVTTSIPLIDASKLPVPYNIPPVETTFSGTTSIDLPAFSSSLINVDSIELQNTVLQITPQCIGIDGANLGNCVSIAFAAEGNAADYYINGQKVTNWTIKMGETCNLEIRKVRLANSSNSLKIKETVMINVKNSGDAVINKKEQTYMNISIKLLNGMDFKVAYGKVTYSNSGKIDPISFTGLSDNIGEDAVLSIYNPTIKITETSNLGVPVNIDLNIGTANSKTVQTKTLTNTAYTLLPAANPSQTVTNKIVIDKENGTGELFKINPDQILLSYNFSTGTSSGSFISKNSEMNMAYNMKVPVQFGSDLKITMNETMKNPFSDIPDIADNDSTKASLLFDVLNRIPLAMKLRVTALDENGTALFTKESGTINAASPIDPITGFASGVSESNPEIELTSEEIGKLNSTKQFKVEFIVSSSDQAQFVTIQPSDYIEIKIGAKINGGIRFNLK